MVRRIAIVLVLALLSSGCTTMNAYEGPELTGPVVQIQLTTFTSSKAQW